MLGAHADGRQAAHEAVGEPRLAARGPPEAVPPAGAARRRVQAAEGPAERVEPRGPRAAAAAAAAAADTTDTSTAGGGGGRPRAGRRVRVGRMRGVRAVGVGARVVGVHAVERADAKVGARVGHRRRPVPACTQATHVPCT